jgi:hypothetical protein
MFAIFAALHFLIFGNDSCDLILFATNEGSVGSPSLMSALESAANLRSKHNYQDGGNFVLCEPVPSLHGRL